MNIYDVLIHQLQTEKSSNIVSDNRYSFKVPIRASKLDVKRAVEFFYKVDVESVNTMIVKGKPKNFRGRRHVKANWKKAVVKIPAEQSIEYGELK